MSLRIVPLGGMGKVTQNMFLYVYENELLIVDCGIGFPDGSMPGVDILIPDISYLLEQIDQGKQLVGIIFSHGHDDHIGALPYLIEHLPPTPIYGSKLTAAFGTQRLKDGAHGGSDTTVQYLADGEQKQLGAHFSIELVNVTHSVPDTKHVVIRTPEGVIYHGSDYKFDDAPVDGQLSDYDRMQEIGREGVLCLLMDCLRVEEEQPADSESTIQAEFESLLTQTQGKFVVTLMSSHIHRIQQVVNASVAAGRQVAFVGRSVEQNVADALRLQFLEIPQGMQIDKRDIDDTPESKLTVIVAGSQGQEGSSLMRAVYGEHPVLRLKPADTVVFSANAIPGNELNYYAAIDELSRNSIRVLYPRIRPNLHHSGHGSAAEQRKLVELVQPEYLMPMGGADRHRVLFKERVAHPLGYSNGKVLLPRDGEICEFAGGKYSVIDQLYLNPQAVDGLGIGDVGPKVLGARRKLSEAGMVVVVVPERSKGGYNPANIRVVSEGFVFMKDAADVVSFIQETAVSVLESNSNKKRAEVKAILERNLRRKLFKAIRREPLVTVVFM